MHTGIFVVVSCWEKGPHRPVRLKLKLRITLEPITDNHGRKLIRTFEDLECSKVCRSIAAHDEDLISEELLRGRALVQHTTGLLNAYINYRKRAATSAGDLQQPITDNR